MQKADIFERVTMLFGSEIAEEVHAPVLLGSDVDVKGLYLGYLPIGFALGPNPRQFLDVFLIFRFVIHLIHLILYNDVVESIHMNPLSIKNWTLITMVFAQWRSMIIMDFY